MGAAGRRLTGPRAAALTKARSSGYEGGDAPLAAEGAPLAPTRTASSPAVVALAAGLALLTACPSYTLLQSPQNLEAGETRIAVAPSLVGGISVADVDLGLVLPSGEVSFRHGVTDRLEFGAKIYPLGMYTDLKFQLLDAPHVRLALAPGGSLRGFTLGIAQDDLSAFGGGLVFNPQVPLLVGIPVGERHQLVIAPELGMIVGLGGSSQEGLTSGVGLQGSLGLGWHFAVTPTFAIMPELAFNRTLFGTAGADALGGAFEAAVGFHFGGLLQD